MSRRAKQFFILLLVGIFFSTASEAALLQGTVRISTGTALSGVTVKAYGIDTGSYASTTTDGSGHYTFDNLPQGQYRLYFDAASVGYGARWYGSAACGSGDSTITLPVTSIADMTFASATETGVIRGTVTDNTGKKLTDVFVSADIVMLGGLASWWLSDFYTWTDANGQYSMTLPVGNYYVGFFASDYAGEYYNNVNIYNSYTDAQAIAVTPSSVSIADAVLESTGLISGTVRDTSGTPISGVTVTAYNANGKVMGGASTDQNGVYHINYLLAGAYKVYFEIEGTNNNIWYNQTSKESATTVSVNSGFVETSNINAILARGRIVGQVTDRNNAAIKSVTIKLLDANLKEILSTSTDTSGNYKFDNIKPGDYKIYFQSPNSSTYLSEWFNDSETPVAAESIRVAAGAEVVANAVLGPFASIAGKVTSTDNTALANVTVTAYHAVTGETAGTATTDANGLYTINLFVSGGTYKLSFMPAALSGYLSSWYGDKPDFPTAQPAAVARGGMLSNLDAVLKPGGMVSGKVTDESGTPLATATVAAYNPATGARVSNSVLSDSNGNYLIKGLPTGTYAIWFAKYLHLSEYYNDKPNRTAADVVTVTAPLTTADINAVLSPSGSISGRLTSDITNKYLSAMVYVYKLDDTLASSYKTIDNYTLNATYTVSGLASGSYKVKFSYNGVDAWYNQTAAPTAATVVVTAPNNTPNIDANFATATGKISGTILDTSNCDPVVLDAYACAHDLNGKQVACGYLDNQSKVYTISYLAPGSYKIKFIPYFNAPSDFPIKWYGGDSFSSAAEVAVQASQTTAGINTRYTAGDYLAGAITGQATDANGKPIAGQINAYDRNNIFLKSGEIDYAGRYSITGLPPGEYKLRAVGKSVSYYFGSLASFDGWYDNKSDFASATSVSVVSNNTLEANFAAVTHVAPHVVTASGNDGGTASPSGATTVVPGSSLTVSISPSAGYQIADVQVDGISVGPVTSYAFANLSKDSTIVASFTPIPQPPSSPTATAATAITLTGFNANWGAVTGATGYYLDVSTSSTFASFISGFNNKDVSNVTNYAVSSLTAGTTYYYRVRSYNAGGTSGNSSSITAATLPITLPIDGVCGAANSQTFSTAPATNLCANGTASAVTGSGPWNWICAGSNGGSPASCSASLQSTTTTESITLSQGWNLISLPVQPSKTAVGTVLGALGYRNLWGYTGGAWRMYDPANPIFSDLSEMAAGSGYWLYATGPATLQVQGSTAAKSVSFASGWNLVGFNATVAQDVGQATSTIGPNLDKVWGFRNGNWQLYDPGNPIFSDLMTLEPGRGYWIKIKQAGTWTLP
ncbi:MAG: carboxypeptidase regulatory-like domain-containing protein [Deltaproteobacteria bacterium]|nr:carboxypeptidase regulatory-like domain-containing protein [Deltaproteobacteria bacterium]